MARCPIYDLILYFISAPGDLSPYTTTTTTTTTTTIMNIKRYINVESSPAAKKKRIYAANFWPPAKNVYSTAEIKNRSAVECFAHSSVRVRSRIGNRFYRYVHGRETSDFRYKQIREGKNLINIRRSSAAGVPAKKRNVIVAGFNKRVVFRTEKYTHAHQHTNISGTENRSPGPYLENPTAKSAVKP